MQALRWILFVPASLLGGNLVYIVSKAISSVFWGVFGLGSILVWGPKTLEFESGLFAGAAGIYLAVKIAPSHERGVAIAYSMLMCIILGVGIFLAARDRDAIAAIGRISYLVGNTAIMIAVLKGAIKSQYVAPAKQSEVG